MIKLTENITAIEVPENSPVDLKEYSLEFDFMTGTTLWTGDCKIDLGAKLDGEIIGITPLSEEVCASIVSRNKYAYYWDYKNPKKRLDYMFRTAERSFISLLESKALDANKKYVIVKTEQR